MTRTVAIPLSTSSSREAIGAPIHLRVVEKAGRPETVDLPKPVARVASEAFEDVEDMWDNVPI